MRGVPVRDGQSQRPGLLGPFHHFAATRHGRVPGSALRRPRLSEWQNDGRSLLHVCTTLKKANRFEDHPWYSDVFTRFSLGSRLHVNRYIQQFTEIFTEEGRKSVKITHQVQGLPPRVMYTQSMREKERLKEKEEQAQQQQAVAVAPAVAAVAPPVAKEPETAPANASPAVNKVSVNFADLVTS